MKKPIMPLGPWVNGLQNVFDPVDTPKGCLVEANNVYIDSGGIVTPRKGYDLITTNAHSLFKHHDKIYGVWEGALCEFVGTSAIPLMNGIDGKLSWSVLNDEPVFTNNTILGCITADGARLLGVEEPGPIRPLSGCEEGTIYMAISYISKWGEESALSSLVIGTSIALPTPLEDTVEKIRIYQSIIDGSVLYDIGDVPVGTAIAGIKSKYYDGLYGRQADTQYLSRMRGGSYARYWRGRLLVARNRTLFYSEPLRYGLYDMSSGFVEFESRIDFIEPVESGVYVALKGLGVRFLAGEIPSKWEQKVADVVQAQAGASAVVPASHMKLGLQFPPDWVAVWFTERGFALGLPNGTIMYPQAGLLGGLTLGNGSLVVEGDRLIVLSQ